MYNELDKCETKLLVDGAHGQYVPRIFAEQYLSSEWGISYEARQILLAGPGHELYWEVWAEEVLDFASRTEIDGKTWFLAQTPEGDLFACHRLAAMTSEQYVAEHGARCPNCRSQYLEGGSFDILAGTACQQIGCNDCDATWIDTYRLAKYEELDIPNNEGP